MTLYRKKPVQRESTLQMYRKYMGIDPDVKKSGIAIIDIEKKTIELFSLSFPEIVFTLLDTIDVDTVTFIEASWNTSHNWHYGKYENRSIMNSKGIDLGRCQEAGRKIVECFKFKGIKIEEKLPLRKIWKGKDNKITHDETAEIVSKAGFVMPKKSNQETRDALLLAWHFANLPY